MIKLMLMNGKEVEVSQKEINEFITQILVPNPYWRHSRLLMGGEVFRYWNDIATEEDLKKIARYILIFEENMALTAFLFDKSEGHPDQGKEFNMPAVKKLRELYQKVSDGGRPVTDISHDVHEMENICMKIGADPL